MGDVQSGRSGEHTAEAVNRQGDAGRAAIATALTGVGQIDPIRHWLNVQYRRWKQSNRLALLAVTAVAWLPTAFLLLRWLIPYPGYLRFWQIESLGPFVSAFLAIIVANIAAAGFYFTEDIILTTSRPHAYRCLRASVRRTALRWLEGLFCAPFLIYVLVSMNRYSVWPGSSSAPFGSELLDFLLANVLPPLALMAGCSWFVLELIQYIVLREFRLRVVWQVVIVFAAIGVVLTLTFFGFMFAATSGFLENLDYDYGFLVLFIPHLLVALYLMYATRRPTPAMLERL